MSIELVIVDDAPFIRESLRHIINGSEFKCVGEAATGDEGIRLVARLRPQLVLMDLVMPVKNGIEATQEILQSQPEVKIVACTTEGQEEMVLLAIKAGCCQFVRKPYTKESILSALRSAMKGEAVTTTKEQSS